MASRVFRFGTFEANETTGELRKQGIRIKLHSQPFQVLVMLLERASELVSREEMRQRLWGNDTFVDFDHSLNAAVSKLREALGDSAAHPRHIETVPGKGYRFIAPVAITVIASAQAPEFALEKEGEDSGGALASSQDLPEATPMLVRALLLLIETMYIAFYTGALANFQEISEIFSEAQLLFPTLLGVLVAGTAAALIPVRLFVFAGVAFNLRSLPAKFRRMFPVLLPLDVLWALSPFLLIHHVSTGLALAMSAALLYMPFAQRSLILMYAKHSAASGSRKA